jgi:hypothetical protein
MRKRWVGHVAYMGRCKMHTKFWLENLKRGDHLEDLGVYGRITFELILAK